MIFRNICVNFDHVCVTNRKSNRRLINFLLSKSDFRRLKNSTNINSKNISLSNLELENSTNSNTNNMDGSTSLLIASRNMR